MVMDQSLDAIVVLVVVLIQFYKTELTLAHDVLFVDYCVGMRDECHIALLLIYTIVIIGHGAHRCDDDVDYH